jgi:hypothetical protein
MPVDGGTDGNGGVGDGTNGNGTNGDGTDGNGDGVLGADGDADGTESSDDGESSGILSLIGLALIGLGAWLGSAAVAIAGVASFLLTDKDGSDNDDEGSDTLSDASSGVSLADVIPVTETLSEDAQFEDLEEDLDDLIDA